MSDDSKQPKKPGQGDAFKTASEVAFLAQDASFVGFVHNYKIKGKFIVPSLVPLMKSSTTINESGSTRVTSSSTGKTYSGNYTRTNYITASIPMNIAMKFMKRCSIRRFSFNPLDTNLYVDIRIPKNTEFVLGFIGEDINKIRVMGVNERGSNSSKGLLGMTAGDLDDEY